MQPPPAGAAPAATPPGAPISLAEFELMKKTALFGDEDVEYLRTSREILQDQTEQVLDVWYGFVGANPHLLHYFTDPSDGRPVADYLQGVRKRFARWILDTAAAEYGREWLDYQFEIGRRHHRSGKNKTDGVVAVDHIPYRYLPALIIPITTTLKPFLAAKGHSPEEVEKMHAAWVKSVTLQVALWSHPYCKDGDF